MYTYKRIIGDWSGDGHDKTATFHFRVNKTKQELDQLESMVETVFGVNYIRDVACDYEEPTVPDNLVEKMKELGHYDVNWFSWDVRYQTEHYPNEYFEHTVCQESYLRLLFELMRYVDPEFKYEFIDDETEEWGRGGGYGLFS